MDKTDFGTAAGVLLTREKEKTQTEFGSICV